YRRNPLNHAKAADVAASVAAAPRRWLDWGGGCTARRPPAPARVRQPHYSPPPPALSTCLRSVSHLQYASDYATLVPLADGNWLVSSGVPASETAMSAITSHPTGSNASARAFGLFLLASLGTAVIVGLDLVLPWLTSSGVQQTVARLIIHGFVLGGLWL